MNNKVKEDIINAGIAGLIAFFSASIVLEDITIKALYVTFGSAALVFLYKLKDGMEDNKVVKGKKAKTKLFTFY